MTSGRDKGGMMPEAPFTILDEGRPVAVAAAVSQEGVRLTPDAVKTAVGWELGPEGLCREAACVPLPPDSSATADGVDLAALAAMLDRSLAVDLEERAAYLGASARDRRAALASLEAPDFTLHDLEGRVHSLSQHRGQKVLLVVYASW